MEALYLNRFRIALPVAFPPPGGPRVCLLCPLIHTGPESIPDLITWLRISLVSVSKKVRARVFAVPFGFPNLTIRGPVVRHRGL